MDSLLSESEGIWIFHGANSRFASGVFTKKTKAEEWISKHRLSGVLTSYPINVGVYDWAIDNGFFNVNKKAQEESEFIQRFTTASQEHYHYENGNLD